MKLDLNEIGSTSLRADFTIVGGGTVGLVVATELARRLPMLEIVVIESGNEFYETTELFTVDFVKSRYAGASEGRFRCLGGTSTRWGGAMIPILGRDWSDFDFGFDISELNKYVGRLEEIFGLESGQYSGHEKEFWLGSDYLPRIGKWPSFKNRNTANVFESAIDRTQNLKIFVNSHVVNFENNPCRIMALGPNKQQLEVFSQNILICAGALESTRLALKYLQDVTQKVPVGLGKNFSDHLAFTVGNVKIRNKSMLTKFNENFAFRFSQKGCFRNIRFEMAEDSDLRGKLPPHYIHFSWRPDPQGGFARLRNCYQKLQIGRLPKVTEVISLLPHLTWLIKAAYWRFVKKRVLFDDRSTLHVDLLLEQKVPNENTLGFGDTEDSLGQKRLSVRWEVSETDIDNAEAIITNLEQTWERAPINELAEFERFSDADLRASIRSNCGSYHPTGTIPLGALSAGGCLDGNFYLHGSENLQILSTAIFPTGGGANPTMMLILMGLKCVDDHVRRICDNENQFGA